MKIKFNWGTGITLVLILFVSFIVSFIIFSQTEFINFVSEDYYPKALKYEEQIQRIQNTKALSEPVKTEQNETQITVKFPNYFKDKDISGTLHFYYILDFRLDKSVKLNLNQNLQQTIDTQYFPKGRYFLKIDWQTPEKSYYQENEIIIK